MSLRSRLQNLRSVLVPGRGRLHPGRRGSLHAAKHRLNLDILEDRSTPSVSSAVLYPLAGADPHAVTPHASALRGDPGDYDNSRILVRFRPDAKLSGVPGTTIGRELPLVSGLHEVRLARGVDVETALAKYRANPLVEYAQPNYRVHAQLTPNDPGLREPLGTATTPARRAGRPTPTSTPRRPGTTGPATAAPSSR